MAGLACLAGARLGRRHAAHNGRLFPLAAGSALALGLVWFLAAWRARFYADTDGLGATLAEWFAHSGKWLVLLAVAAAGHGFIGGAKQIPPTAGRKVFYFAAVLGVAALVLWKTVPVYFLLGDGQRDADGFVRESEKLEVTCGAVALLNALEQFHGAKNLTEREVSKVCGVTQEGTTTAALVRAARHFGLTNATARGLTGRELEQQKLPVIVAISTLPQNRDEYLAANVFWLPPEARWHTIKAKARSPEIGKVIDDAMGAIERENPTLKGVLPRDYARPSLDKVRLGGLVDIISNIGFNESAAKSKDVLGRVYEYFLGKFASAEGKGGGEFYTPQCVVQVLVAMLEPYKGRVFDPCCGSGGMFVSSEKFVEEHGGRVGDIAVYGQESNYTTWKLARMNLAIRGIDANLGPRNADSFRQDLHPDLKADFVPVWKDLANPPFNMSDWGGDNLRSDVRWKFGMPPVNNANYGWIQNRTFSHGKN